MEFSLKPITFFGRTCVIICQNENGPCPLLAIANILLLQNRITVDPDRGILSLAELIQIVANAILEKIGNSSLPEHITLVESVLNILPKLAHGLDLNVQFTGVDKFEFTEEISVFDALGIRLLHGWLCNPEEAEEVGVLGNMSYNHVLFRLVEYKSLSAKGNQHDSSETEEKDPNKPAKEESEGSAKSPQERKTLQYEGAVLERFLQKTASQFTYHGMLALYNAMQDRQFAVFFRNNHFSALFFYNGQLFTLVTDLGYRHEPTVVWELLNSIDGDCEFFNSEFAPLSSLTPLTSPGFFSNFPDVHAAVPSSPGASAGSSYPGGGTIAAPPAGYKFAPTTCAPPASKQPTSPTSAVSASVATSETVASAEGQAPETAEQPEGPAVALSAALVSNDNTENSNTEQVSAKVSAEPEPLSVDSDRAQDQAKAEPPVAAEDSYEIIDANALVAPASGAASGNSAPTDLAASAPVGESASPTVNDGDVHVPTVTQPLPTPTPVSAPPPVTTPSVSSVPAPAGAAVSSYDADLRLAMQLQAQEDAEAQARALAVADSHWSAQTQETSPYTAVSPPALQQGMLSQEESDRQFALMLNNQEMEAQLQLQRIQQQHQQQRAATSATLAQAERRAGSSGSKKDNCIIS